MSRAVNIDCVRTHQRKRKSSELSDDSFGSDAEPENELVSDRQDKI